MATFEEYEIVDVTFDNEQETYTYIAVDSQQAARINGLTGEVTMVPNSSVDPNVLIVPQPGLATPIANDAIVKVDPAGPIVRAPSSTITPSPAPGSLMKVPDAGTLSKMPPSSTVGSLMGLANKQQGAIAKIIAKLGRAGKLVGSLAGWAALTLSAISAIQQIFGSPENDKNKAGQYNGQKDPVPASPSDQTSGVAAGPPSNGGSSGTTQSITQDVIGHLESENLVSLVIRARCGELSALGSCLCDSSMRRAAKILETRFSEQDRRVLFNEICGCAVMPKQTTTQPTVSPTVGPTMPTKVIPAVNPTVNPPTPTGPQCYTSNAPPVGTYPTGWKPTSQI